MEKILIFLAWHLPKSLVKWCFIRVASYASCGDFAKTEMDTITVVDALKAWPV